MLATRDLTFAYRRSDPAVVTGLTHAFTPGAVTAVTGPSGRGKSTLLYLVALMLSPERGSVLLDGADTAGTSDAYRSYLRATRIGMVFQDALLDPARTVVDNVVEGALYTGLPAAWARRRAVELLERTDVAHRADHRPGEISGGQAQRVALCRALVKDPPVLLADEPTGNLDPASADVVWGVLADHARAGATVVVATHDPARVAACDERVDL